MFGVVSVFDQEFCVIQTVINPLRAVGSSKLCVRVLFCARIASGVVFEYTKSDKRYVGGRGGVISSNSRF